MWKRIERKEGMRHKAKKEGEVKRREERREEQRTE